MTTKEYDADGITVLWDSSLCIHSAHCVRSLPGVFQPKERPWINADAASAADLVRTIDGCPSGALGYRLPQDLVNAPEEADIEEDVVAEAMGIVEEASADQVTITVEADGPLAVAGPVKVVAADGTVIEEAGRVWLCRCGHSAKKPLCDGSHRREGFTDPGLGGA